MSSNKCEMDIESEVQALGSFVEKRLMGNYIGSARFYRFKGLGDEEEITFDFPFTAIVGANGSGKSSVLHALYGMPEGESTSVFWFSTELDPIEGVQNDPPRYVYSHWHKEYKNYVETRKARVFSKRRNYEYWEPTKITKKDGMEDVPKCRYPRKKSDRWNAVEKDVVYLNMRRVIGAFDRAFSFGLPLEKRTAKHKEMLQGARRIKSALSRDACSWNLGGGSERIFENRELNDCELSEISRILGRKYVAARYLKHSLFTGQKSGDTSVVFDRGREYSEAFAGSGEVSVVEIVVQLLRANDYALVLIDEPETSLHPGAQRELLRFMLSQIKKKRLQIVVSTHSTDMIYGLPDQAIKVVEEGGEGKSRILNQCSPYVAFHRLGRKNELKSIYVEDPMAKALVERAVEKMDPGEREVFDVKVTPGGWNDILSKQVPSYLLADHDFLVLLDGDQRKVDEIVDEKDIPPSDNNRLEEIIAEQVGCKPSFSLDGGSGKDSNWEQKVKAWRKYLRWAKSRLGYLPSLCPEAFILEKCYGYEGDDFECSLQAKSEYRSKLPYNATSGEHEVGIAMSKLLEINIEDEGFDSVRSLIKSWLAGDLDG